MSKKRDISDACALASISTMGAFTLHASLSLTDQNTQALGHRNRL